MSYRKFRADHLFTGIELLPSSFVLVTDAVGKVINVTEDQSNDGVEVLQGIISPGFVNAHCHLELSHLKGKIETGQGMVEFVSGVMKLRCEDQETRQSAIEAAEAEMLRNGIVAVGDICNSTDTVFQKKKNQLAYYHFIEATGFIPANAAERFEFVLRIEKEFAQIGESSIVPHAPYSVSPPLFKMISGNSYDKTISMHNQESISEADFFLEDSGDFFKLYENLGLDISFYKSKKLTSLQTVLPNLQHKGNLILVHNVTTSITDIAFAKDHADKNDTVIYWCLCPNANVYIGNALPDIKMFIEENANIILGTDSLASNSELNILAEIKTIIKNFPEISTDTLLTWATINGASALQMQNKFGSFEEGKTPGVILIENTDGKKITPSSTVKRIL